MAPLTAQELRALVQRATYLAGIAVIYAAAVALIMVLALAIEGYFGP